MQKRPMVVEVVDDAMARSLRSKTPAQRLAMTFDMWRGAARVKDCNICCGPSTPTGTKNRCEPSGIGGCSDQSYITDWASKLGLLEIWTEVQKQAGNAQ